MQHFELSSFALGIPADPGRGLPNEPIFGSKPLKAKLAVTAKRTHERSQMGGLGRGGSGVATGALWSGALGML